MWSLFPQTSSSNLNNNLYLPPPRPRPPPPPGFGVPGEDVRGAPGPWLHRGLRPALPRSRRRPRPGGAQPGGTGAGQGDGCGLGPSLLACLALPSPGPPPRPAPEPPRRPRRPALPRVRSSGTFSSPLSFRPVRNRHTTPVRNHRRPVGARCPARFPQPQARSKGERRGGRRAASTG